MTSKEIAELTVIEFAKEHDIALGAGAWIDKARVAVNDAFHMARDNRKSVTKVAYEIVKAAESQSCRYGEIMNDYVVGNILSDWFCYGWLTEQEKRVARKAL
jgi:hypothetical protein